jgi:23S rRNA (pseudouridine1915-N3)-methyltransferase
MSLELLTVGKSNEAWLEEIEQTYSKKISQLSNFKIKIVKGHAIPRERSNEKILDETKKLLAELKPNDFVVLFDEKGKKVDSLGFAKLLSAPLETGKNIIFVIGGAFGSGEDLKKRANLTLSFSDMTFNHLIARAVALEQIYRALTIWKRIPYHN